MESPRDVSYSEAHVASWERGSHNGVEIAVTRLVKESTLPSLKVRGSNNFEG